MEATQCPPKGDTGDKWQTSNPKPGLLAPHPQRHVVSSTEQQGNDV